MAPVPPDGADHDLDVAVEQEERVVGQPPGGEPRRLAQIHEHRHDLALASAFDRGGEAGRRGRLHVDRDQRPDRDVSGRTDLAGQAYMRRRVDPIERAQLVRTGCEERFHARGDAHAAGGAAAAAAADRLVRDAGPPACFQHGEAGRDRDHAVAGIGDAQGAKAPDVPIARRPQQQGAGDEREIAEAQRIDDMAERRGAQSGRRRRIGRADAKCQGAIACRHVAHIEARADDAEKGEHGHQGRERGQGSRRVRIPPFPSQPRPHADT